MQSDNKVSSFLLLILIGLGIYLLLNRGEGFRSLTAENFNAVYPSEPFEDVSNQHNMSSHANQQHMSSDELDASQEFMSSDELDASQEFMSSDELDELDASQEFMSSDEPDASQDFMSSDEPDASQEFMSSTESQQYMSSAGPSNSSSSSMQGTSIFNFEPNDESIFDSHGSTLTDAFAPPIPAGTNTGTIDFKKQNMDNYNAKDFLPNEINDEWFETDFSLAKYQLNDDKLINTERYIIGINTVGQSLKNASHDIRGTIPNPKFVISPWNNSTYEPDFNLKPLC